jgi:hypothetical protein
MKIYTISNSRVTPGAVLDSYSAGKPDTERTLHLGDYSTNGRHVPMFKKNVPVIKAGDGIQYGGMITDAHPVKLDGGYALAKPNQESDDILVVIRTGYRSQSGCKMIGSWSFDSNTVPTPNAIEQTIARGTGSTVYEDPKIGWHDALIVMKVGDSLTIYERTGDIIRVKYESTEAGLMIDTRVRMILQDYDAAPDGVGMYTKLDAVFASRQAALRHKRTVLHDMYWGTIKTLDGVMIQELDERHEHENYD